MISGKWRTVAKNLDSEGNLPFDVTVRLVMLQLAKLLIYVPYQHSHIIKIAAIDTIIQLGDERWGAVEIKLGAGEVDKACDNLLKLKNVVDTDKMNEPSFLMVLTGTEYAFQMKNGIWIVPLGCLKN